MLSDPPATSPTTAPRPPASALTIAETGILAVLPQLRAKASAAVLAAASDPAKKLFGELDVEGDSPLPAVDDIFMVFALQLLEVYDRPPDDPHLPAAFTMPSTVIKLDASAGATIFMAPGGKQLRFRCPGRLLQPVVSFHINFVKVRLEDMALWLDLSSRQLAVAFESKPQLDWDINVSLTSWGILVASWLEDYLTPWITSMVVSTYN